MMSVSMLIPNIFDASLLLHFTVFFNANIFALRSDVVFEVETASAEERSAEMGSLFMMFLL